MMDKDQDFGGLDDLFDHARDRAPMPSARLMEAVLADAVQVQGQLQQGKDPARTVKQRRAGRVLSKVLAAIGGWPSAAGLAAAAVTGVWIGVSPPELVDTLTTDLLGASLSDADVLYGFDILLAEG